jgi:glycogen debranching enzyme
MDAPQHRHHASERRSRLNPAPRKFNRIMDDIIRLTDDYYIVTAASSSADVRVLKHDDSFGVFDHSGDIQHSGLGEQGIYYEGTRFLSALDFRLGNLKPFLLSSTITDDNLFFTVNLTNPDLYVNGGVALRRGDLHIFRSKFIWQGRCYESFEVSNYSLVPVELSFTLRYDADFADIFEVRGLKRAARGEFLAAHAGVDQAALGYRGVDGVLRRTVIDFVPAPEKLTASAAFFHRTLQRGERAEFSLIYSFEIDGKAPPSWTYLRAAQAAERELKEKTDICVIRTSNQEFNSWLDRSLADLKMMLSKTEHGLYPYAGVPWFSTPFGRDGIITALSVLWLDPHVARGVLGYLAAYQAKDTDPERDATPGKILHEVRRGEMAALNEVPFGLYYGSTDATPLFVMLAGAYYERTGDHAFLRALWPAVRAALDWIDLYGDIDGDGFVESARLSSRGLVQQGWKDSWDSISHSDGALPAGPIALCEVQAYAYEAKRAGARLAAAAGEPEYARALLAQAETLRKRFNEVFWCDDLDIFAVALDGEKRPCRITASNAGHCLFTGIARPDYAERVADRLLRNDCFSAWGVRTLATGEVRYNPMSYHNGSVWPHDNAIFAAGLARYGFKDAANEILSGLFDASTFFELNRLPELFCGFQRRNGEAPTQYPVACAPQAWSAASVFLLLQACLGLSIDGAAAQARFRAPALPAFLETIYIENLKVGEALLDLAVDRSFRGIGVERRQGEADVVLY